MKGFTLIEFMIVAAIIVILPLALYLSYQEHVRWKQFVIDHKCRVISKVSSTTSTGYGVMSDGTMGTITTTTPGKTGYLCDDEVTYWRSN